MNRKKDQRFKKDYSNKDIIQYLQGVYKLIGRSPTYRDLLNIPGPSARTIVRRFGLWSTALKASGIRPKTNQLMKGERSFIRSHWNKMTDSEIGQKLGVSETVIKYYRKNYHLWKNRKGTARSTYRSKALSLYGKSCEVCNIPICEWHHIIPKSINPEDWCILCPLCHAVITRKLVKIATREDLQKKLKPFIINIYRHLVIT